MKIAGWIFIFLLFINPTYAQKWHLVWSDEFEYVGLPDSTKWLHETGKPHNKELQTYTYKSLSNSKVENGNLLIIAQKDSSNPIKYSSARLSTYNKFNFKYGKIEASIKLPTGQGLWPAFWLLGQNIKEVKSPKCGEIDIVEHVNSENQIHNALHWDDKGLKSLSKITKCDVEHFQTYAVEWNKRQIKWFLNGEIIFQTKISRRRKNADEFRKPFYILLNVAVGGSWPGQPDQTTIFPDTMLVDFVRVYQK